LASPVSAFSLEKGDSGRQIFHFENFRCECSFSAFFNNKGPEIALGNNARRNVPELGTAKRDEDYLPASHSEAEQREEENSTGRISDGRF